MVGQDDEARIVRELLDKLEVNDRQVLPLADRCTTVKERLLGRAQQRYPHQMMRVDREADRAIPEETVELLLSGMARCMDEIDLVLVSDYNKGVCKGELIPRLVKLARAAGVPVIADPVRDADYHRYAGCACITPNRVEAGLAIGRRITTPQEGLDAAKRLLEFGVDSALVTLDRDGMAWADAAGNSGLFPIRPRQVCDVTGAGDMVLAALGYMIAAGADYPDGDRSGQYRRRLGSRAARGRPLDPAGNPRRTFAQRSRHGDRTQDSFHRADGEPTAAASPGRPAGGDDQRLLRSFASRPRRHAARGAEAGRLSVGRAQQRPQRAGVEGHGASDRR